MTERIRNAAFKRVDISSLVVFRMAVGLILFLEVAEYWTYDLIYILYIQPNFFFPYMGLEWIKPWPNQWMYLHFLVIGLAGVGIALGYRYRLCCALGFGLFGYSALCDKSLYLNHYYLFTLIAGMMFFIPANGSVSYDAAKMQRIQSSTVPVWCLWLARFHVGLPYFFGGISKLNADWLACEPMRGWLSERTHFAVIGQYFTEEWMVALMSHGGLIFDLAVVPLLLWKRTRLWAYLAAVAFHVMNMSLFNIALFPWFMIMGTTIFLAPDWPRRFLRSIGVAAPAASASTDKVPLRRQNRTLVILAIYAVFHVLFPLRHFAFPGNVFWTMEGYHFSWMMKSAHSEVNFRMSIKDPETGKTGDIDPREYLTQRQLSKMAWKPRMVQRFAHHIAEVWGKRLGHDVEVYTEIKKSLHGRDFQLMIDPTVNLAAEPMSFSHAEWIVPLDPDLQLNKKKTKKP